MLVGKTGEKILFVLTNPTLMNILSHLRQISLILFKDIAI